MQLFTNYEISPVSGAVLAGTFSAPAPIAVETPGMSNAYPVSPQPAPPGVVTATTAGPTVTDGSSGMNDAVPSNGSLFSSLAGIGAPASAPSIPADSTASSTGFTWVIWAGLALGAWFAFFRK